MTNTLNIAVIGTGMAATAFASTIQDRARLTFFEKARGAGGRLSTRRRDDASFDHGAQFFTARTPSFRHWLAAQGDAVQDWQARVTTIGNGNPYRRPWFEPHFVAVPAMNHLCKQQLADRTRFGDAVAGIAGGPGEWRVITAADNHGPYDWIISTAPAEQAGQLLAPFADAAFAGVAFLPCFALMGSLAGSEPAWEAAVIKNSPLAWVALNHRKPGRGIQPSFTAHSEGEWAARHFDDDRDGITAILIRALTETTGIEPAAPQLHRWKYAKVTQPLAAPCWFDGDRQLGACGDWCLGDRVEDAFVSGEAMAHSILAALA